MGAKRYFSKMKYDLLILFLLAALALALVYVFSGGDSDLIDAEYIFDEKTGVAVYSGNGAVITREKYGYLRSGAFDLH